MVSQCGIDRKDVIGLERDRAGVKEKACRRLLPTLPCCNDLECICRGFQNIGKKFVVPTVDKYLVAFNGIN
jgi:hypothetical protein